MSEPGLTDVPGGGEYTGAYLVLLARDDPGGGLAALRDAGAAQMEVVPASDPDAAAQALDAGAGVVFPEIDVAVVPMPPDVQGRLLLAAEAAPQVLAVERERVVVALPDGSGDFWRGYRAGVNAVLDDLESGATALGGVPAPRQGADDRDESRVSWGLQVIRAHESCVTGRDVKVAVLDTGFDLAHRDFAGRPVATASFVAGEDVADGNGHGTHCIGTACGPGEPVQLPRYGVAGGALIHAGKVLSNAGRGADGGILAGISWAVGQGCRVVSMSLGAPTQVGAPYSRVYEAAAVRALERGTIIVAAAGNDSRRPDVVAPVSHPANCPSILAVAALGQDLQVARFSCAGLDPDGGQVDIAAPGVDVLSSWPEPAGHRRISGTSMATPHVAGVLALLAEANPGADPATLKNLLLARARRLTLPASDVGAGLVQAP